MQLFITDIITSLTCNFELPNLCGPTSWMQGTSCHTISGSRFPVKCRDPDPYTNEAVDGSVECMGYASEYQQHIEVLCVQRLCCSEVHVSDNQ